MPKAAHKIAVKTEIGGGSSGDGMHTSCQGEGEEMGSWAHLLLMGQDHSLAHLVQRCCTIHMAAEMPHPIIMERGVSERVRCINGYWI